MDPLLEGLPAHFESTKIHVAGLIVASYAGEDYSTFWPQALWALG